MKKSSCGFGEEDCFMFVIENLWELMALRVGAFITLHTKYESSAPCGFREENALLFYVFPMTPPGLGLYGPKGSQLDGFTKRTFIRRYKQNRKRRALWFWRRRFFFYVFSYFHDEDCKSVGANDPWGGVIFNPRGMVGRIYKEDHYTLLRTKYESSGPCGFGEQFFSHDAPEARSV